MAGGRLSQIVSTHSTNRQPPSTPRSERGLPPRTAWRMARSAALLVDSMPCSTRAFPSRSGVAFEAEAVGSDGAVVLLGRLDRRRRLCDRLVGWSPMYASRLRGAYFVYRRIVAGDMSPPRISPILPTVVPEGRVKGCAEHRVGAGDTRRHGPPWAKRLETSELAQRLQRGEDGPVGPGPAAVNSRGRLIERNWQSPGTKGTVV
jgi:hypothetical protein